MGMNVERYEVELVYIGREPGEREREREGFRDREISKERGLLGLKQTIAWEKSVGGLICVFTTSFN